MINLSEIMSSTGSEVCRAAIAPLHFHFLCREDGREHSTVENLEIVGSHGL